MLVSIIIRTLNEQKHLKDLLQAIQGQDCPNIDLETVIVDSGSTDETLKIAKVYGCKITHIQKTEFTFGKSLNMGCEFAKGEILVFISGHCIPCHSKWLANLIDPIVKEKAAYSYGRQIGWQTTRFSEERVFAKYYPDQSRIPQQGFFCNNANAALSRTAWITQSFDEQLTGLEDMHLAKKLVESGQKIAYVAEADVHHIHDETWRQVRIRYEREAIALRSIMPEVHVHLHDACRYFMTAVFDDLRAAFKSHRVLSVWKQVVAFRFCQFWGGYRGHHLHRVLSSQAKERYFYPTLNVHGSTHE